MARFGGLRRRLLALARPRGPESLPVRFDRRRIYVLPTRFGLFFAALLAAMSVGGLNYNNNPALLMAFLLAGAAMSSLVSAQLQLSGLSVVAVDAEPVHAGRTLHLRVHTRTTDRRVRSGLKVDFDDGDTVPLALRDGTGEVVLDVATHHRGWLDIPRLRVQTTWPLGLARAWSYVWPETPVLVYPRPEALAPPLPIGSGDPAARRLHAAGDDVHHLRNYRAGDSRRAIAWKPSARRGTLLVREFEQPIGTDIDLDWRELHGLPHEVRVARLARWVEDAERDGRRYRLWLPGQPPLGPERGPAHRHACLRALALMPHG
ncbi:DUF58 domain-containing protein [Lysobacter sp. TY2-98]|uniref:DUF58 domain-containing protein n=1 Tax=Lysobacter sp. TY2-98 TaxID=2290922 RepID=UPI000E201085|nr:DUF58 domain-containing protein [Lysobacter sp. TY2-98]AXK72326.1 DUF58 domain-containing protein [Lysobacter sp. TY2-98]